MASVFLSYDHEDSARAAPLAAAIEAHGHTVWWDRHIHGGAEYNSEIESAVESSDAVVVLWSANSVRSAWVRDEASEGRDRCRLVPVLIDAVKPPMGFRQYQTIDLVGWSGGKRIPRLPELIHAIERVAKVTPAAPAEPAAPAPRPKAPPRPAAGERGVSRRLVIGGAAAGTAALAGGGLWWFARDRTDPRFRALMDQGEEAFRHDALDKRTIRILEQAVAIEPGNAKAWGLLALVKSLIAQTEDPGMVQDAERTARRALSLDPENANGLLAMFELQGSTLDWATRDQSLRKIIAIDPKNIGAMAELVLLLQATGFCRESWDWNERALTLEPLSPDYLGKRALKLWILGRTSEADKVSDQIRALYPTNGWAWFVRFHIYAFTGRARAAQAMLDGNPTMSGRPPLASLWRAALPALDQPSAQTIASAREACIEGAQLSAQLASDAVQIMSVLRELDTAFEIADGLLLAKGTIVQREQPGSSEAAMAAGWRIGTQWMFTPATVLMRADPRFRPLTDGMGLTEYWRKRGLKPDYQRA